MYRVGAVGFYVTGVLYIAGQMTGRLAASW